MCCYDKILINVATYVIPGWLCVWCGVNSNLSYRTKNHTDDPCCINFVSHDVKAQLFLCLLQDLTFKARCILRKYLFLFYPITLKPNHYLCVKFEAGAKNFKHLSLGSG
jgi:hypothetical protein